MSSTQPRAMEVQRSKIDKEFDRYVLALNAMERQEAPLQTAVLEPMDPVKTVRKAHWEARVHHNALAADPFSSDKAAGLSVAYFVNAEFELMQVVGTKATGVKVTKVYAFPRVSDRAENATVQVAGKGLIVYCDGNGSVHIAKASDPANVVGCSWEEIYTCEPLGCAPLLLVAARFDQDSAKFRCLLAQPLTDANKDAAFKLAVLEVMNTTSSDSMDVDSGAVGLQHSVTHIATGASVPSYACFSGPNLVVLVEGVHQLSAELLLKQAADHPQASAQDSDNHNTHKRHHEDSEMDGDMDELLAKHPRAGLGYHGEIQAPKSPHQLGLDASKPLEERFCKSSTPFSSLDEPLHSVPSDEARAAIERAAHNSRLELPTPDTILGGFEECDDVDPNASAALLLYQCDQQVFHEKFEIYCRNFRYLAPSAPFPGDSQLKTLLFQHDVHGLVYRLNINMGEISMEHVDTLPAFGFVQASKQEKKFMSMAPSGAFATICEFEKRVFLYHGECSAEQAKQHVRTQCVVEIGDLPLLGMQLATDDTMLLLTPRRVLLLSLSH